MELKCFFYHKVSSFFIPCFLNTCALQYRLALRVSDANVNKDEITSKNTSGIVSDSNSLWVHHPKLRHICSKSVSARCTPVFKRFGYRGKEKGFYFLTLRDFPDAPGTHRYVSKTSESAFLHDRSPLTCT